MLCLVLKKIITKQETHNEKISYWYSPVYRIFVSLKAHWLECALVRRGIISTTLVLNLALKPYEEQHMEFVAYTQLSVLA